MQIELVDQIVLEIRQISAQIAYFKECIKQLEDHVCDMTVQIIELQAKPEEFSEN